MVDSDEALQAVSLLRMVIAGLAEQVIDMVASAEPPLHADRIAALQQIATSGTDIARLAGAAIISLESSRSGVF